VAQSRVTLSVVCCQDAGTGAPRLGQALDVGGAARGKQSFRFENKQASYLVSLADGFPPGNRTIAAGGCAMWFLRLVGCATVWEHKARQRSFKREGDDDVSNGDDNGDDEVRRQGLARREGDVESN
jgi:hypothetical protein